MSILKYFIEELKRSQYKIYVDMDGTITDWISEFMKIGLGDPNDYEKKYGTHELWNQVNQVGKEFWSKMAWLPDGKKLWNFIEPYNPIILTKPTRSIKGRKLCIDGKKEWLARELPGVQYIIEDNKEIYAEPNAILIDDMKKNIDNWNKAGGIGILHINADQTINELKTILSKELK